MPSDSPDTLTGMQPKHGEFWVVEGPHGRSVCQWYDKHGRPEWQAPGDEQGMPPDWCRPIRLVPHEEATPRARIQTIVDEQLAAWDRDVAAGAFQKLQAELDILRWEIVRMRLFYDPAKKTIIAVQFPGESYVRPA